MKKTMLGLFILAMVISLSGCLTGREGNTGSGSEAPASQQASNGPSSDSSAETLNVTGPGQLPIVKEKITLKVMIPEIPKVTDFATNEFTKQLEEKTNIHLEWDVVPQASLSEKLNLMLTSGDYPDILIGMPVDRSQESVYGQQGVFLPLNDLIDKYGVETKKLMETKSMFTEIMTSQDGNIYALPMVNECYHCSLSQKMWIYQPWLDKLGLQMPTTTDEFYNVLKAFKERDPNGNNKADELPLMTSATLGWYADIDDFLMNSFIYNDVSTNNMIVDDHGKIDIVFNKPEWKEGLKYIRKLYQEGLFAPESFTQDATQLVAVGNHPGDVILGATPAGYQGGFITIGDDNGKRWLDYKTVPPLKGPENVQYAAFNPVNYATGQFIIMKGNQHPEASFRLADLLYSQEMSMNIGFGLEGEHWEKAAEGDIGINGKPATWKLLTTTLTNRYWGAIGPINLDADLRLGQAGGGTEDLEVILYNETIHKYDSYKPDLSIIVPPLVFSQEESVELAELKKMIYDYKKEMLARFVTGNLDIDQGWDTYVNTLNDMRLGRYLEIYQNAYEAQHK